jgi:hypothetical protein
MAAKPTIDPPGPMGWTSTIRTAAVHAAKASSNPAPAIKFLFFNEMSSCDVFGFRLITPYRRTYLFARNLSSPLRHGSCHYFLMRINTLIAIRTNKKAAT